MRFLVLGGNSFLGREFVNTLVREDKEFLQVSKTGREGCKKLDIFDLDLFTETLDSFRPNIVVNFAWFTSRKNYTTSEENWRYYKNSLDIYSLLNTYKVERYVGIGSGSEYGEVGSFAAGFSKLNPRSIYAQAKAKTFQELLALSKNSYTKLSWARVFQPFGIGQHIECFIPSVIRSLRLGLNYKVTNPHRGLDWIHISDIASGLMMGIAIGLLEFDLGTGKVNTNEEIFRYLSHFSQDGEFQQDTISDSLFSQEANSLSVAGNSPLVTSGAWTPKIDLFSELSKLYFS